MSDTPDKPESATALPPGSLEMRGVHKVFKHDIRKKKQIALNQLHCTFRGGQCTGLLGHNGAGKTTAIRVMLGLIRPDQGDVLLNGRPLTRNDRRRIGYMPEINKLPKTLTPHEILHYHLELLAPQDLPRREYARVIRKGLEQVELWDHRTKLVRRLSKGMGRRLAWLQATLHNPDILILDEPMSGLDPVGRSAMRAWIREFRKAGRTIVLCSHELATVQQLCDAVCILRRGNVVFSAAGGAHDIHATLPGRSGTVPKCSLQVSGTTADNLATLLKRDRLPQWQSLHSEGFLHRLTFATHAEGLRWLATALSENLLVVRFAEELMLDEDELLVWFGKDLNG